MVSRFIAKKTTGMFLLRHSCHCKTVAVQ